MNRNKEHTDAHADRAALSINEVAALVGVSRDTVERAIRAGRLNVARPTPHRVLIPVDAFHTWLTTSTPAVTPSIAAGDAHDVPRTALGGDAL